MKKPASVATLTQLGRERLSKNFFMRDFLYSDIAAIHGFSNIPDDPDLALTAGRKLCGELLEPLQETFGRIAIRSAYRSQEVNGFGNAMQKAGKGSYNCSANRSSAAGHIWDLRDEEGCFGATACIVIPSFCDRFQGEGDWRKLAWWIHDHLPYSHLEFYPIYRAFNIQWHEKPRRSIYSYVAPKGYLTKPGFENHEGSHEPLWRGIVG